MYILPFYWYPADIIKITPYIVKYKRYAGLYAIIHKTGYNDCLNYCHFIYIVLTYVNMCVLYMLHATCTYN